MKKQILFVAMFTLAIIFAGTDNVFGQALLPGITSPTKPLPLQPIPPIICATSATALNPVPGVPFTYAMTNAAGEPSVNWTWYATKDQNFISVVPPASPVLNIATQLTVAASELLPGTSAGYGVDNRGTGTTGTPTGSASVTINWSSAVLAATSYHGAVAPGTPTFVVGYSENSAYCTDNLQVFEINPQPNFTIDIAAIDAAGATLDWGIDTEERCVDRVQSAVYDPVNFDLNMDYGTNTIYYEVAAANFVTNFAPQFRVLGGLNTTQTAVISIYDSYANASAAAGVPIWTSATIAATDVNATNYRVNLPLTATNIPDVATGVSFYVKVVIDNNTEESLADNPFILAVDAQDNVKADGTANTTSIWDMEDADCPTLADAADQVDQSTITITPRPTLNMVPTTTTGEPGGAAPDDHIIKTN
jgi:hypothetical protein